MSFRSRGIERTKSGSQAARDPLLGRRRVLVLLGGIGLVRCGSDESNGYESTAQGVGIIDGGVDVVDKPSLLAALDAYTDPSVSVTIIIDRPTPISSDRTVPPHVTLRFQDAGQIKPIASTLKLQGPIEAAPNPFRPLFDMSGGGDAVPGHSGTTYHPNWWSDASGGSSDIGVQWNNMTKGLEPGQKNGGNDTAPLKFRLLGVHTLSTMMDIRSFRGHQLLDFTGSVINVSGMSGGVAVNFTKSAGLTVRGLTLTGNGSAEVGVLLSRGREETIENNIQSSHAFRFYDLRILGLWPIAALYNIASESNIFFGGRWENLHPEGLFTAYFCHHMFNSLETDLVDDYHTFTVPASPPLPYDASNEQPPPGGQCPGPCSCQGMDGGCTAFNPPDVTTHGNELIGVTIVNKAVRGALYLRSWGNFSLHDARIASSAAPYLVMHAADYVTSLSDLPCCIGQDSVGPIVVRNLVGEGHGTKPVVALKTIGPLCGLAVGPGQGNVLIDLNARLLETSGTGACELLIGRNHLSGRVSLPGAAGVRCDPGALVAAEIELRGVSEASARFGFAAESGARIRTGDLSALELPDSPSAQVCGATPANHVPRGVVRSVDQDTPRTRHYSPLSIMQRGGAPATFNNEAVLFVQQGELKLKIRHNNQEMPAATLGFTCPP